MPASRWNSRYDTAEIAAREQQRSERAFESETDGDDIGGEVDEAADVLGDGARGTRTPDLLGAIQALFQLSYSPEVGEV